MKKKCFFNQKVIKFCLFMNKSSVYDHALTLLNEKNIYYTILTLKL